MNRLSVVRVLLIVLAFASALLAQDKPPADLPHDPKTVFAEICRHAGISPYRKTGDNDILDAKHQAAFEAHLKSLAGKPIAFTTKIDRVAENGLTLASPPSLTDKARRRIASFNVHYGNDEKSFFPAKGVLSVAELESIAKGDMAEITAKIASAVPGPQEKFIRDEFFTIRLCDVKVKLPKASSPKDQPTALYPTSLAIAGNWYEGGTLHRKGALDWQEATAEDKLATCADFVAGSWSRKEFTPRMQASITKIDDMKPYAITLVTALDAATKKLEDKEKNKQVFADQEVAGLAVFSMKLLRWYK